MARRTWSRDQLIRKLEILGPLHDPLPPTLPPSPPVSRPPSPAPALKRKLDPPHDPDHPKRPRRTSALDNRPTHALPNPPPPPARPPHPHHPHPPNHNHNHPHPHTHGHAHSPPHIPRGEPEDGELREEPVLASSSRLPAPHPPPPAGPVTPSMVPIRRPKRGKTDYRIHDALHDKYHDAGRKLKYSGDARFWSTYPTTHKEYRPLADPPPPSSPYHKYGGIIARLELVDALVCFTYAIWNKDYGRKNCYRLTWATIDAFLAWCKQKWLAEEGILDAEKAFVGLIFTIEGFINARKVAFMANQLEREVNPLYDDMRSQITQAALKAEQDVLAVPKPPAPSAMLPSPASIAPTNSANSTPINGATPDALTSSGPPQRAAYHPSQGIIPDKLLPDHYKDAPIPAHVMDEMVAARSTVPPTFVQKLWEQTAGTITAGQAVTVAQNTLNISTLCRFFPNTFARVVHSTLSATEEHEPDFEDEEGELFWPGQCINGEGLGWVCLVGKAMIKEFGKAYGYRGLDGAVPKPKPEEADRHSHSQQPPPQQQRPGSTPHGHTPAGYSSQR